MSEVFQFRLDMKSGVPVYRQLIDQVLVAIAAGQLTPGDQLPTVRQLAVDLSINPNTVVRAYKELEIRGMLTTQQGTGTFITAKKVKSDEAQRQKRLSQMLGEFVARVSADGYTVEDILERLNELAPSSRKEEDMSVVIPNVFKDGSSIQLPQQVVSGIGALAAGAVFLAGVLASALTPVQSSSSCVCRSGCICCLH